MTQNRFLYSVEAPDSHGKESVTESVYQQLKALKIDVVKLSYPNYDSPTSTLVKMYLNGDFGITPDSVNPHTASTFYAVDRIGSYLKEWKESYERGAVIISDRYTGSNLIHQASKVFPNLEEVRGLIQWLHDLEHVKLGLPETNNTFFLHMPFEVSQQLMKNRLNKIDGSSIKDIHESDVDYMHTAYKNAQFIASEKQWQLIECLNEKEIRPIVEIANEIVQKILIDLNNKEG